MRGIVRAVALLLAVEAGLVLLVTLQPGDVCDVLMPEDLSTEAAASFRAAWACDAGLLRQLAATFWGLLTLNLGDSPRLYQPVRTALLSATAATLALSTPALLLGAGLGVVVGWTQAFGSRTTDRTLAAMGAALGALPSFGVAVALMLLAMWISPGWPLLGSCHGVGDCVRRAVLPILTLCLPVAATHARLARNALRAELRADYALAARARGIPEGRVRLRHIARNALPAWLAVLGLDLPWLLTGALIVEVTFGRPGLGDLLAHAAAAQDLPVLIGGTAIVTMAVLAGDLLTRAAQRALDPRTSA